MTPERSYNEREVAEILERATTHEARAPVQAPAARGLTLAQLQEIAAEVGIAPARIEEAARAVASRQAAQPVRRFLGAPRSVARVVPIPRALDDEEWSRLVVDLRTTFGAQGDIRTEGTLRSWTNGNLQVHVEPEGDHYRVRMQTMKGDVSDLGSVSGIFTVIGLLMGAKTLTVGADPSDAIIAGVFTSAGLTGLGYLRGMLPRWADTRARQMEGLAERIPRLLKGAGDGT